MFSTIYSSLPLAALFPLASAHVVFLSAQGLPDSAKSIGFGVDNAIPRDCTGVNPCQQDSTLIRAGEIAANLVGSCGRSQLKGPIDIGESTEIAIKSGDLTQVNSGGKLTIDVHQVNADGAGPFVCDIDQTSNTGSFTNLTVEQNVPGANGLSLAKTQVFEMVIKMPDDLKCIGGSTGNVCTVRCRNEAQAGPFGGCIAVQQADTEPNKNNPDTIETAFDIEKITAQTQASRANFAAALRAHELEFSDEAERAAKEIEAILADGGAAIPDVNAPEADDNADNDNNDAAEDENRGGNRRLPNRFFGRPRNNQRL